jgi:hypothetical protein
MKSEADCRLKFEKWPVAFIDKNNLAEAGFYYTDHSDVLCCAFCVAQIGLWQEGDDAFKEHRRCYPNCEFVRVLSVWNIPIGTSDHPTTSYVPPNIRRDVGSSHFEFRPNFHPERCKYT